jgi:hypothetical protein
MEEVTRSHKEIQDGVAGVDRTIRTILEVSRDLREMTGRLAKTFSWFEEVLETGEQEGIGEPAVIPELPETKPAELETAYQQSQPLEIPELAEGAEEGQLEEGDAEEAAELVEALDEEEQLRSQDDLSLTEDLDELGVVLEAVEPEEGPTEEAAGEQAREPKTEDPAAPSYNLEDVEELEAVEEEIEELEGVSGEAGDSGPSRP